MLGLLTAGSARVPPPLPPSPGKESSSRPRAVRVGHFPLSLLKAVCTVGVSAWGTDSQAAVAKTLLGASLSGALWPFREGCLANEGCRGAEMRGAVRDGGLCSQPSSPSGLRRNQVCPVSP